MRNRPLATGRLLRSVALRYCGAERQFIGRVSTKNTHKHYWRGKASEKTPSNSGKSSRDERLSQLEAVLFLSSQPVGSRKLAQLADLADGTKARTLVRKLNRLYDAEGSAFRIEEVAGGFQLLTRMKFAPWLRRLHAAPVEIRLSGPAMETLAVIAYRQPVLRAEVEAIRGVQSGEVLRQLIERDMVRIVGRSDELGRPFLYGTGKRFLQVFGMRHLDELPRVELMRTNGAAGSPTAFPADAAKDIPKPPNQFPEAEEEKNVKTLTTTKARPEFIAEEPTAALMEPERRKLADLRGPYNQVDDEDEDLDDEEDDEDLDDEEFDDLDDDDEEEEEEKEEELEDEWEEVDDDEEDDDDDEDDDDWDDEDWDDDDWDDEDDDFDDDDEDEDEEEDEEEEEE
jgi:segregation and condensation protein B